VNTERNWLTCDPVLYRAVAEWRETWRSVRNPTRSATSISIYIYEFDRVFLLNRIAYWTSRHLTQLA
jgi:hypothetical protein